MCFNNRTCSEHFLSVAVLAEVYKKYPVFRGKEHHDAQVESETHNEDLKSQRSYHMVMNAGVPDEPVGRNWC